MIIVLSEYIQSGIERAEKDIAKIKSFLTALNDATDGKRVIAHQQRTITYRAGTADTIIHEVDEEEETEGKLIGDVFVDEWMLSDQV